MRIAFRCFVAAALQDGSEMQTGHGANHRSVKGATGESKSDEPNFNHGRYRPSKMNGKEYRIFEFQAEGLFRNAKLPERAVSFRMTQHS